MKKPYFLLLIITVLFAACNKKETATDFPAPVQSQPLMAKGIFKMNSFGVKSGAAGTGGYVRLNWSATNEYVMQHWVIERATSGENWHMVQEMPCSLISGTRQTEYMDKDLATKDGDVFQYRVRVVDAQNNSLSSHPVRVRFGEKVAE